MTQVSCTITINAPADAIWQVIGDFCAVRKYLTGIAHCTVVGEGVGALRTLTSTDGSTIVERLEALDEVAHRLSYTLLTDTPFGNCLTTMTVWDLGPSMAEVAWSATFEPDGLPASEAVALIGEPFYANYYKLL
jgi:uncharacterized protein YndB with AHSA1/START domain